MKIVRRAITIGCNVWIAADAFVGPGVTLGDDCLLAARSSAFHDLPAGQVCIGEPAKPRRARYEESQQPTASSQQTVDLLSIGESTQMDVVDEPYLEGMGQDINDVGW